MFNFYIDNKKAGIKPVYKKDDPLIKLIMDPLVFYRFLSKAFERCLYDQIYEYIDTILSKVQCGFRKRFQYTIFINCYD